MKKLFAVVLAVLMLLALGACGAKKEAPVTGGWSAAESIELSEEAREAFEKAMEGLTGVDYEPLALIGTQLVSGTNYAILCEARAVAPDAQPYYAVVFVYRDLQGGAKLLKIAALDLGAIAESGKVEAAGAAPEQLVGGWTVDRESSVELEGALLHLASQVVSGSNHCLLCEGNELVFVYENLEGETEVTSRAVIDPGVLLEAAD
ncbi:MAG: hypothetical protein IJK35_04765 [Oscillospiraceae bacterium]|nr:hypothetical protein [Oscillospiraceae bacterium]